MWPHQYQSDQMWNEEENQKIGNGHDLMLVRVHENKCAEKIRNEGKDFWH